MLRQVEQVRMAGPGEEMLAKKIAAFPEGGVYSKHVARVDFGRLGLPAPLHINMVRDPVERLVSWFYYVRAAWSGSYLAIGMSPLRYIVDRQRLFPSLPLPATDWIRCRIN
jgi:hypothetical protein